MPRLPNGQTGEPVYVKGRRVPFTFWPDNYLKYGTFCASNPWQCMLSVVGSETGRVEVRCRSYIEQSYDFYNSSKRTSLGTQPLMLYYSYLNLVNAFLFFRTNELPSSDIRGTRHGLFMRDYPEEYRDLTDIRFSVMPQSELYFDLFRRLVEECAFTCPSDSTEINLLKMMYQIPGVHDAFISRTETSRAFYPVELKFMENRGGKHVWLEGEIDTALYEEEDLRRLRAFLDSCPELECIEGDNEQISFQSSEYATYRCSPGEVLRHGVVEPVRKHFWSEQTRNGFKYYLGCENGFTAQVVSNFAVMFALGMVVRYAPELLEPLEREWVVHEYLATQPLQFAYLVGSGLVRNEIVPTPLDT